MIPANKSPFWEWGFHLVLKRMFKSQFNNLFYRGTLPSSTKHTLFLVNHSTWWDPLIIFLLNKHLFKANGYGMMHEEGLKSFPIFRRIGTFSINRSNPKDIIASLNYAKDRINEGKAVWIFPQGDERPLEQRPLEFQTGASFIIEKSDQIHVIPISLYYAFEEKRKPNIYVSIGQDLSPALNPEYDRRHHTQFLEDACTDQLDHLKKQVMEKNSFHTLF